MAKQVEKPTERVARAYARIADVDRPEIWITLRPAEEALEDAVVVATRLQAGEELPLAGLTLAVKDNIDVADLPTTAGCPAFSARREHSAPVVAALVAAGAVVLGKVNMDQFATGLAGTRSPYGAVRDARRPDYVSGGSSSGSAVAVALGIADIGLGSDTAGSIRVPAAFQGVIGIKPTIGLVDIRGVVPANRSLDCVSVLARELELARLVLGLIAAAPTRPWPPDAPLAAPPRARIGVPDALPDLSDDARERFAAAVAGFEQAGHELVEFELAPFLAASELLYSGPFMAERYDAVGAFIGLHPSKIDPTVRSVILRAGSISGHALAAGTHRLGELRVEAARAMDGLHALLLPTAPRQPRIDEVQENPVDVNASLSRYVAFGNMLDLCAVTMPAGEADGGHFGVTLYGRAFADALVADLAGDLLACESSRGGGLPSAPRVALFVTGAHRSGQAANAALTDRGGALVATARTAADYRLRQLPGERPGAGLEHVDGSGTEIEGELWELPPLGLAALAQGLAGPAVLGQIRLADGREVLGLLREGG